jgi:hypothetical protein
MRKQNLFLRTTPRPQPAIPRRGALNTWVQSGENGRHPRRALSSFSLYSLSHSQRGHWFPSPDDVTSFRSKIVSLCPFQDKTMVLLLHSSHTQLTTLLQLSQKNKKYKLIIYQRNIDRYLPFLPSPLISCSPDWWWMWTRCWCR